MFKLWSSGVLEFGFLEFWSYMYGVFVLVFEFNLTFTLLVRRMADMVSRLFDSIHSNSFNYNSRI